jgi:DNA-binding Xre family transcriptional regulator
MALEEKSWNLDEMATQRDLEPSKSSKFLVITIEQQKRIKSRGNAETRKSKTIEDRTI